MALSIFNSYSGRKEKFVPENREHVKIYNCGPTVYGHNHIGNYRSYLFVDILRRYLIFRGYKLEHAMNITDVDDKIINGALKEGKSISDFTKPYIESFMEDIAFLRMQEVEHRPRATAAISSMIELISELEKRKHIYSMDANVYFRIQSFAKYGRLAHLDAENLVTAAEGRFDADEYTKEDARDFALWKSPVRENESTWESPWGKGRPGWHLECSAMIRQIFGEKGIDIHVGGIDLLFPHHENEIAQSVCAYPNDNFVRFWMHNEHLLVDGRKMSKSLGNYYTLRELSKLEEAKKLVDEGRAPEFLLELIRKNKIARALRYLLLSFHYRTKLNFTFENVKAADASCERMQTMVDRLLEISGGKPVRTGPGTEEIINTDNIASKAMRLFLEAMDDDLNTARALAAVFDFIRQLNLTLEDASLSQKVAADALSFFIRINKILDVINFESEEKEIKPPDISSVELKSILELIEKRSRAREMKNFSEADRLRDELQQKGVKITDTARGTEWEKV